MKHMSMHTYRGKYENFLTPFKDGFAGLMRTEHLGLDDFPKLVTMHVVFHISIEEEDCGVIVEVTFLLSLEAGRFLLGKVRKSFGIADGLYHEVDIKQFWLRKEQGFFVASSKIFRSDHPHVFHFYRLLSYIACCTVPYV